LCALLLRSVENGLLLSIARNPTSSVSVKAIIAGALLVFNQQRKPKPCIQATVPSPGISVFVFDAIIEELFPTCAVSSVHSEGLIQRGSDFAPFCIFQEERLHSHAVECRVQGWCVDALRMPSAVVIFCLVGLAINHSAVGHVNKSSSKPALCDLH
jgi:hypothetical protein